MSIHHRRFHRPHRCQRLYPRQQRSRCFLLVRAALATADTALLLVVTCEATSATAAQGTMAVFPAIPPAVASKAPWTVQKSAHGRASTRSTSKHKSTWFTRTENMMTYEHACSCWYSKRTCDLKPFLRASWPPLLLVVLTSAVLSSRAVAATPLDDRLSPVRKGGAQRRAPMAEACGAQGVSSAAQPFEHAIRVLRIAWDIGMGVNRAR